MELSILRTIFTPLLGTTLGAASVLFFHERIDKRAERAMNGFAAGVMVAASVWSLLIPALDRTTSMGKFAFFPVVAGFWLGTLFMLALDRMVPHLHGKSEEGPETGLDRSTMLLLAVTIHNIPEGMALGVVIAGWLSGGVSISEGAALALAVGLAIQNFPEGAIVSLPMHARGMKREKAFINGFLSGVVEPVATVITMVLASRVLPFMAYSLSFAAGVMVYVVVEELIPETAEGTHSNIGVLAFAAGFTLMMTLDIALG
ncbi:Zinc transporter ZupT [Aedoeadaptatus ivorii]|uniref:Zinc transporter ZupT n=1 Tax=Aedoeadaptatus ivorii TaxID=54006 RepID=A0A448V3A7_9FIRM|nr:ZIP family metal transporter [Peptoniphilus ivorii]MDQ0508299.1 ZIP family zinc transporter [Peptoniphilus ivorii]VEJ36273.1 Zinc transporter ZupT [Peptoniphilus ivorii]